MIQRSAISCKELMGFYEEISEYYDVIFPTGREQVEFLFKILDISNQKVLDVACGTGGYSMALAEQGHQVTGIDLDFEMIRRAKLNGTSSTEFFQMDMLAVNENLQHNYDLAYCIGNSLVHLPDNQSVAKFLKATFEVLKAGGTLALQIINFDRVLDKGVTSLPTLKDEKTGLEFVRNYSLKDSKIMFQTILTVNGKRLENEIPLLPLRSKELGELLKAAGFGVIELFGDFKETPFDPENSFMLVVKAKKD